jgi:hypothetical protein
MYNEDGSGLNKPSRFCGGYLAVAYVDCRGGMGCQARRQKVCAHYLTGADKDLGFNPDIPVTSAAYVLLQADNVDDSLA